jgi:hypothetical protein
MVLNQETEENTLPVPKQSLGHQNIGCDKQSRELIEIRTRQKFRRQNKISFRRHSTQTNLFGGHSNDNPHCIFVACLATNTKCRESTMLRKN